MVVIYVRRAKKSFVGVPNDISCILYNLRVAFLNKEANFFIDFFYVYRRDLAGFIFFKTLVFSNEIFDFNVVLGQIEKAVQNKASEMNKEKTLNFIIIDVFKFHKYSKYQNELPKSPTLIG